MLWNDNQVLSDLFKKLKTSYEGFVGCTYCDSYQIGNDFVTLNPFVWPYSGTSCPDDIRVLEKDRRVNPNSDVPLVSAAVPDHAAPTN
jgi:hypothetical protein